MGVILQIKRGEGTPTKDNLFPYELGWSTDTKSLFIGQEDGYAPLQLLSLTGGPLSVDKGGTGATNKNDAAASLGFVPSTGGTFTGPLTVNQLVGANGSNTTGLSRIRIFPTYNNIALGVDAVDAPLSDYIVALVKKIVQDYPSDIGTIYIGTIILNSAYQVMLRIYNNGDIDQKGMPQYGGGWIQNYNGNFYTFGISKYVFTLKSQLISAGAYLPLSGGTITGQLTLNYASCFKGAVQIQNDETYPCIGFITTKLTNHVSSVLYSQRTAQGEGRMFFRHFSWADASTSSDYYEDFLLPLTSTGLTSTASYHILTTKEPVTIAQGGTGAKNAKDAREALQITPANIGAVPTSGGRFFGTITMPSGSAIRSDDKDSFLGVQTTNGTWKGLFDLVRDEDNNVYTIFRQYKGKTDGTLSDKYEHYYLPVTSPESAPSTNESYEILTSKKLVAVTQGGTGASSPSTARAALKTARIQSGKGGGDTEIKSNSYYDFSITFPEAFSTVPIVVVGFSSGSSAGYFGRCCISVNHNSETTTGFTARVFNGDSSARKPAFTWIATEP